MEKFIITMFQLIAALVELFVMCLGCVIASCLGKEEEWTATLKNYNQGKKEAERERREKEMHEAHLAAVRAHQHRHGVGHAMMHKAGEEVVGHILKHIIK